MLKRITISLLVDTDAIDFPIPTNFGEWTGADVMRTLTAKPKVVNGLRSPIIVESRVQDFGEVILEEQNQPSIPGNESVKPSATQDWFNNLALVL
jgi:hypothetical protein